MSSWLQGESSTARRYVLLLFVLAIAQLVIKFGLGGFTVFPDTEHYVGTIDWFRDRSGVEDPLRIQRPLEIILAVPLSYVLNTTDALKVVNAALYLVSIPFIFAFSAKLLRDEKLAFISSILFLFSFCVLYWGLGLGTDMMQLLLICICFSLLVDIKEKWNPRDLYKVAAVVGLGMLNKESIIAVAFILIALALLKTPQGSRLRSRLAEMWKLAPQLAIMAAPFVAVQALMYVYFGPENTFFGLHISHKSEDIRGALWYLPLTFIIGFNILLLLYLPSIRRFLRSFRTFTTKEYLVMMALLMIPIVSFEQYSPRLSFLVFPLILPVTAAGTVWIASRISTRLSPWLVWGFLALYIVANNAASLFGDEIRELLGVWAR